MKTDNLFQALAILVLVFTLSAKASNYNNRSITDCFTSIIVKDCSGTSSILSDALTVTQANVLIATKPFVAGISGQVHSSICLGNSYFCCTTIRITTSQCAPEIEVGGVLARFIISEIFYKD